MTISEHDFAAALSTHIPRFTGIGNQDGDRRLIDTLTKYSVGLLKQLPVPVSTPDGRAKLCVQLEEFFGDRTADLVDWLVAFVRVEGDPFNVAPAPATRMKSTLADASISGKQERDFRDVHQGRDKNVEMARTRSRSPGVSPHFAPPRGSKLRQHGHRAVFEDAVRRTGGQAGAGAHPLNLKVEARNDDSDLFLLASPEALKKEMVHNTGQVPLFQEAGHDDTDPRSVVITNIHFEATPEQVGLFFDQHCHTVNRVTILKNALGMPKGYAYMELSNEDAAQVAISMSGMQFLGRTIKVVPKLKTPPPQPSVHPWMMHSMAMMEMLPYMMPSYPFAGGYSSMYCAPGRQYARPSYGSMTPAARAARFHTASTNSTYSGTSDVWLRGIHDLGSPVGV